MNTVPNGSALQNFFVFSSNSRNLLPPVCHLRYQPKLIFLQLNIICNKMHYQSKNPGKHTIFYLRSQLIAADSISHLSRIPFYNQRKHRDIFPSNRPYKESGRHTKAIKKSQTRSDAAAYTASARQPTRVSSNL